jgi:hypothetical protein
LHIPRIVIISSPTIVITYSSAVIGRRLEPEQVEAENFGAVRIALEINRNPLTVALCQGVGAPPRG